MEIIKLHPNLLEPKRGTDGAAGYDLFMPEAGATIGKHSDLFGLGFAAKVPEGHVALILPRSSAGVKHGIHLGNTVGVIDSDYEGEWKVNIRGRVGDVVQWAAGERLFQFVVVPVATPTLKFVNKFTTASERGSGGFGSTDLYVYLPIRDSEAPTGFSFKRKLKADLTHSEKSWHAEKNEFNAQGVSDPEIFTALYEKWFGVAPE